MVKAYLTNSSDQLFSSTPYTTMNNGGQGDLEQMLPPHMAPKSPTAVHFDSGLILNSSSSRNITSSNSRNYHPPGININTSGGDSSHHSISNNNQNHAQDILHSQQVENNYNYQVDQGSLQHVAQHQRYPSALKNGDVHSIVNYNNNKNSSGPGGAPKKVSWNDSNLQNTSINANEDETQSNDNHDDEQEELNTMSDINNDTGNATAGSASDFTLQDIDEVLCSSTEQEGAPLHLNTPNVIGAQEVYRDPRERMMLEKMKNQLPKAVQGPEKLSFQEKMKMFAMESGGTIASKGVKSNPSQLASGKSESSDNNRTDSP